MNKKKGTIKYFVLTAIIVSAVFVLVGCNKKQPVDNNNENQNNQTNTQNQNNTEDILDVSQWKTYRNEEYAIEFKYPPTWEVEEFNVSKKNSIKHDERAVGIHLKELDKDDGTSASYISFTFTDSWDITKKHLGYPEGQPKIYSTITVPFGNKESIVINEPYIEGEESGYDEFQKKCTGFVTTVKNPPVKWGKQNVIKFFVGCGEDAKIVEKILENLKFLD